MTPSQITALEHAGVKVEDAEGKLRFEFIDIIKPEPMRSPKSNIEYVDPLEEATKLPDYNKVGNIIDVYLACLLYTSPSPRDRPLSRMPSAA